MSITGRYITMRGGNIIGTPPPFMGLLDLYPNAAAAWSLRLLRSDYTGACIRVRRSSDNAETDIGFDNNVLDTAALLAFVGSGNGFVTTWYDQSTNAYNAVQTSAGIQPFIVISGSLQLFNNKVSIDTGTQFGRLVATLTTSINTISHSFFQVSGRKVVNQAVFSSLTQQGAFNRYESQGHGSGNTNLAVFRNTNEFAIIGNANNLNQMYLLSKFTKTSNNRELYVDSSSFYSSTILTNNFSANRLLINNLRTTDNISGNGFFNEVILYANDQSANRTAIETNINNYYAIY